MGHYFTFTQLLSVSATIIMMVINAATVVSIRIARTTYVDLLAAYQLLEVETERLELIQALLMSIIIVITDEYF